VYTDKDGFTVASNNLRDGINSSNKSSIYAAHAALGLSVSDVILQGCHPVIVEGTSDQYYMNAVKWLESGISEKCQSATIKIKR
jgi:transcription elongation factor